MSEIQHSPIQFSISRERVIATWIDGTAIWTSGYLAHDNPELERQLFARRCAELSRKFNEARLFVPTVETFCMEDVEGEGSNISTGQATGRILLRVTTLLVPLVDPNSLRPIYETRTPTPTLEQAERSKIESALETGGKAVLDSFRSALV